jgi:DNA-binding CsgD family transcriptional regulator
MSNGANVVETEHLADEHETRVGSRRAGLAVALFAAIAVLIGVDVAGDARTGVEPLHVSLEGLVMVLALVGVAALWRGFRAAEARAANLEGDLQAARAETGRYKAEAQEALAGLGHAIDAQFERWELTGAEREVGLLLLKGLTHREAAEVRKTSEATVRQQALAIYRKSGLRSRSDLSAFFLEDLLLPRGDAVPAR